MPRLPHSSRPALDGRALPRAGSGRSARSAARPRRRGCAGRLRTPTAEAVTAEIARFRELDAGEVRRVRLLKRRSGPRRFRRRKKRLGDFARSLSGTSLCTSAELPAERRKGFSPLARQQRQVAELEACLQLCVRIWDACGTNFARSATRGRRRSSARRSGGGTALPADHRRARGSVGSGQREIAARVRRTEVDRLRGPARRSPRLGRLGHSLRTEGYGSR